jgi:hypothetical protein
MVIGLVRTRVGDSSATRVRRSAAVGPSVGGVEYPLDIAGAFDMSTRKPADCLVIWLARPAPLRAYPVVAYIDSSGSPTATPMHQPNR